jgi:DNA-binding LacI/PurR family transcriptional regulator
MRPTIADVAREASVGIGTVSRVLNRSPLVSAAARERVLAAMDRLGYQPSATARAFGRRRTHTIELLVPLYAGSVFLETVRGVEQALADSNYTLLVRTVGATDERDRVFDECCGRASSDGVLVVWMAPTDAFADRLANVGIPVVLLNTVDSRMSSVAVDHDAAAEQAAAYCLGLGHRRLALVDRLEDPYNRSSRGMCERGYQHALTTAGVTPRAEYTRLAEFSAVGGAAAMDALLQLDEPPTAVVAASDAQAVGVIEVARIRGWSIPGDVSVVGYNDSEVARFLGLTTVLVPVRDIAREATARLLGAISDSHAAPETTYLPTELARRRTCGPPRR